MNILLISIGLYMVLGIILTLALIRFKDNNFLRMRVVELLVLVIIVITLAGLVIFLNK